MTVIETAAKTAVEVQTAKIEEADSRIIAIEDRRNAGPERYRLKYVLDGLLGAKYFSTEAEAQACAQRFEADCQAEARQAATANLRGLCDQLGTVLMSKNRAYGNSAVRAGMILETLYPDGIEPEWYGDVLLIIRILDKLSRIATQHHTGAMSDEDPWLDIAGYGVLGLRGVRIARALRKA